MRCILVQQIYFAHLGDNWNDVSGPADNNSVLLEHICLLITTENTAALILIAGLDFGIRVSVILVASGPVKDVLGVLTAVVRTKVL